MKITDLLKKDSIDLNVQASQKEEILEKAVELMSKNGNIINKDEYLKLVIEREKEGSTGIGEEIAIPHGKGDCISDPGLVAMVIPNGVDFESLDEKPVKLLFLIAAPNTKNNVHLEVLSRLSTLLMDEKFRKELIQAKSKEEFLKIIDKTENQKNDDKKEENYEILGITACPTGIAHTYMAAEALEQMGNKLMHPIKIETQGQSGAKNILTDEEIKKAKAIIIAADVNVDLSRFNGKRVLRVRVSDGIHKPKELIEKVINEELDIPIYYNEKGEEENNKNEKIGGSIYKHLMNGVTHMLPFVVGGGILIAIAFLLDDYSINPSNFGMNTPVAAFFKTIGDIAFDFMLLILSGYIAMSIGDRPRISCGICWWSNCKSRNYFYII
jgi:PTS system fructose-specific IIC component